MFLVAGRDQIALAPTAIGLTPDRTNLLPFGEAVFDFGIEEAVLEITFAKNEDVFIQMLKEVAKEHGHVLVETDKHFISNWIVVNPERHVLGWDVF